MYGSGNALTWNRYPVCVEDCFYTPLKHFFNDAGVKKCHAFPATGKYALNTANSNELSTTPCTLFSLSTRRCANNCSDLNTAFTYTPYGAGPAGTLITASSTEPHRNDPNCVASC
jgi:hypothetical protein